MITLTKVQKSAHSNTVKRVVINPSAIVIVRGKMYLQYSNGITIKKF